MDPKTISTAVTNGCDHSTHDLREFERVPGLVVRRPVW